MSLETHLRRQPGGSVHRRGHCGVVNAETSCSGRIKRDSFLVGRGWRVQVREGGYLKFKLATPYRQEQLNEETRRLEADSQ